MRNQDDEHWEGENENEGFTSYNRYLTLSDTQFN